MQAGEPTAAAVPTEVDAALAETIVGLQRLLTQRHLATLRRWLDVFSKVRRLHVLPHVPLT